MKRKLIIWILVLIPFGIASNIYTDLRGYKFGLFKWVDVLFPIDLGSSGKVPDFVLYNLPDGLWLLSLLMLIYLIWENIPKLLFSWYLISFTLAIAYELLQVTSLVQGTFDWLDLITYSLIFFAINIITLKNRHVYEKLD